MHSNDSPAVNLAGDIDYDQVRTLYDAARIQRRLTHSRSERFPVVDDCLDVLAAHGATITHSHRDYDNELTALVELGDDPIACLNVGAEGGNATLSVAARDSETVQRHTSQLLEALRRIDTDVGRVALRLWSKDGRSPTFSRRVFDAPTFDDVAGNYPTAVRGSLEGAFEIDQDAVGGLALWYGPPGTGKTTAVRALARAWRSWCDVHVIVDPETLLSSPGYLMKVITERSFEDDLPKDAVRSDKRSRLIVLEDAGELLAADAREATGQGLSRILNVTDGLVGRGLSTSILITTNEEIGRLHPAIRRPGRCWSQLRFGRFPGREARGWLDERGVDGALDVSGSRSLAELYALQRGEAVEQEVEPLGFRV